jgi:hypothetical protein
MSETRKGWGESPAFFYKQGIMNIDDIGEAENIPRIGA